MGVRSAGAAIGTMRSGIGYRYVFSLDLSDVRLIPYFGELGLLPFKPEVLVGPNQTVIEAVNRVAALVRDEELMINLADDFGYREGWDVRLLSFIDTIDRPDYLVHVTDMDNAADLPVIQIVSTAFYRRFGYFFFPEYISMFADNELLEVARRLGACKVYQGESLGFDHRHPNWGKGVWDDTYSRENTPEAYRQGHHVFTFRKNINFGL